jgi:hypothetical protein
MKLKAVLHKGCQPALVKHLQSQKFRSIILDEVLKRHLHVFNFGPAEFYIQECDFACGSAPMCEVRLTGVSVTGNRATNDFVRALAALEHCYVTALEPYHTSASHRRCQLLVSMMLDRPPFGMTSPLLERDPVHVPK